MFWATRVGSPSVAQRATDVQCSSRRSPRITSRSHHSSSIRLRPRTRRSSVPDAAAMPETSAARSGAYWFIARRKPLLSTSSVRYASASSGARPSTFADHRSTAVSTSSRSDSPCASPRCRPVPASSTTGNARLALTMRLRLPVDAPECRATAERARMPQQHGTPARRRSCEPRSGCRWGFHWRRTPTGRPTRGIGSRC